MSQNQLEAVARGTRFYADTTSRSDMWIYVKYSTHYLRRFELYVREANATITQARGQVDSVPEGEVNAIYIHNRGEVVVGELSLWHFAIPNQAMLDNIDQQVCLNSRLASLWTPSHIYHFKGYGGNRIYDRARTAEPLTLGFEEDAYYWQYSELADRTGRVGLISQI